MKGREMLAAIPTTTVTAIGGGISFQGGYFLAPPYGHCA
jgi:hypothetical protein